MREIKQVKLRLPKKKLMQIAEQDAVIEKLENDLNSLIKSISQLQSQL